MSTFQFIVAILFAGLAGLLVSGKPIKSSEMIVQPPPCSGPDWTEGPGPGGKSCYKFYPNQNILLPTSWFRAGEECSFIKAYTLMSKEEDQREKIMELWRTSPNFYIPGSGIFVGFQALGGYWAWLDNSTFDTSLFCNGVRAEIKEDDSDLCGIMRTQDPNPGSKFCFDRVQCDDDRMTLYSTICEDILNVDSTVCPTGWEARPETIPNKTECYYVSDTVGHTDPDKSTWNQAFCYCYDHKSMLADIVTWEEAIWLAKKLQSTQSFLLTQVLLGLTCQDPLPGWTWVDGTSLQNYTKYFWKNNELPVCPPAGQPDDRCSGMTWIMDQIMHPRIMTFDCETGSTRFACKMNADTMAGIFPEAVMKLQSKIC